MTEKWVVLKFGGTSVAGRSQWETIAGLARSRLDAGYRVLIVCSAVAGVTSRLELLADQPESGSVAVDLLETHRSLAAQLEVDDGDWLPEARKQLQSGLRGIRDDPSPAKRAQLISCGEWFSTCLGERFLQKRMDAGWVDAREALQVLPESDRSPSRQWLSAACEPGADAGLAARWSTLSPVLITQGFLAGASGGATALLGRGGSDTSAALLAGRLCAERLEIWTDVPGLFSADPRLISTARLLNEVDYAEALEMAASGARVVQSRCIRAAAATGTPIFIRDVHRRGVPGTRIGSDAVNHQGIKTITCQQDMVVMLMQNLDNRYQVGFLARVFDVFRRRGVSVDLVATSETTTTVAVDRKINHLGADELAKLTAELSQQCLLQVFPDCVCVNLVGRGVRTALARLQGTMRYFDHEPLLMLSQSANDLCLSMLMKSGAHEILLKNAHEALIPPQGKGPADVFGDSWTRIRKAG